MIAATHIALASGLYLGGSALLGYPADPIGWAIAAGASLFPDIDLPASVRVVIPGRPGYRMEVGSKAEMLLLSSFVVGALALYPVSQMGLRGGLHELLKNFDMAFDEYRESAGTRWYSVELAAIDFCRTGTRDWCRS